MSVLEGNSKLNSRDIHKTSITTSPLAELSMHKINSANGFDE